MPTTVSTATLKVTIQEEIILNGVDYGSKTVRTIAGIGEYQRTIRRVKEDTTMTLLTYDEDASTMFSGIRWFDDKVKYVRVTNMDSAVTAEIIVAATGPVYGVFKLLPGESFLMVGGPDSFSVTAGTGVTATTFLVVLSLTCHVTTGDCDLELVVAGLPST